MSGSDSVGGGSGGPESDSGRGSEPRPADVGAAPGTNNSAGDGAESVAGGVTDQQSATAGRAEPPTTESPTRRLGVIALFTLVATMATYFAMPIYDDSTGRYLWLRLVVFVVGLAGLVFLLVRQISVARTAAVYVQRVLWLFTAICLVVLVFAVTYLVMARSGHAQFVDLWTKTDALYFTVTVLTTVGFGDVHATGQAARLVVTLQMGIDVLFIATAGSALRAAGVGRRRLHLDEPDVR